MKSLQIQIHPKRRPDWDADETLEAFRFLAKEAALSVRVRITNKNGRNPYINAQFWTADLRRLWQLLKKEIRRNADLRAACIAVCQGNDGWSDYLLLHHYDPNEPLDRLGRV